MRILWTIVKKIIGLLPPETYTRVRRQLLFVLSRFGYSNSQYRMDKRLLAVCGGKKNGVFVEAGAADGVDQSNTLYLERCHGWTGLLVEPVREQYKACKNFRKRSAVERAVLGRPEDSGKTFHILTAALQSVVQESKGENSLNFDQHVKDSGAHTAEDCPVATLTELLVKNKIGMVDVMSLDVEGAERMVLDGLDTGKVPVRFLLVEAIDPAAFKSYAAGRGWTFLEAWGDNDFLFRVVG